MSQGLFSCPLILQSPGNIIFSAEMNAEFTNIKTNFNPSGMGGYQDSTAQKQLQEDPATGLAASVAKELEQIRFALKRILGKTYWYDAPDNTLGDVVSKITGPASAVDNAFVRYDGITGKLAQASVVGADDTGVLSGTGKTVFADSVANSRTRTVASTVGLGGVAISGSSGSFNTTSSIFSDVPNLSAALTTNGRPVQIRLIADGGGSRSYLYTSRDTGAAENDTAAELRIRILRDGSTISEQPVLISGRTNSSGFLGIQVPPGCVNHIDTPAAGTYTYKIQAAWGLDLSGTREASVINVKLVVDEM